MSSLHVPLPEPALRALADEARRELRTAREQAAYLIVEGLRQRGALSDEHSRSKAATR